MENNFLQDYLNSIPNSNIVKTSIQNIKKSLSSEILISRKNSQFIPFVQERDGMNKIINSDNEVKQRTEYKTIDSLYSSSTPKLRLRQKINPIYPSVGSYNLKSTWLKKSYSKKPNQLTNSSSPSTLSLKLPSPEFFPSNPQPKDDRKLKSSTEKRRKLPDSRLEEVIERKALRNPVQRPLGTWNSLRIHGTPEEIKEELKFSQQKAAIKKYQIEIKSMLNELKR